ncbi:MULTISPECIES: DUF4402 domain-containing protein [unclassified Flavobacterium]|uniref:DUF4402 domain-containing protein n=1 Tax=unclassified Flavobacterium TaxID=196869 RepID=UPI003F8F557E
MKRLDLTNSNIKFSILFCSVFLYTSVICSQPSLPSRALTVNATQQLSFGTFALTGGGDGILTIGTDGFRTAIQNIYLSELSPYAQPAVFDIRLCQGRNVRINFEDAIFLTRPGGGTMRLELGPARREGIATDLKNGDSFSSQNNCNFITILRLGGKLYIPANSLSGIYTGSFEIMFEQE